AVRGGLRSAGRRREGGRHAGRAGAVSRVVVVGGGFGGLAAARSLAHGTAEVVVVDRANHHLFQPLLYRVATGVLAPADIAPALRQVLARRSCTRVVLGTAEAVEPDDRVVRV